MGGLLLLLVIVVFWVALGLFSSQQKFAVPKAMRELARPLSPIADEKTLAKLETKKIFSQAELANFTVYKVIVNEVNKQLRLVDISYSEKIATNAAKTNIQTQVVNEPDLASSSSVLLVEPVNTETGVAVTPTPYLKLLLI
jgi:hypothetical protein